MVLSTLRKKVLFVSIEPAYWEDELPGEVRREELIGGKIVMMAPPATNHGVIAGNIHALFHSYLRGKACTVFPDDVPLFLSDMDYYRPDLMVVCDREKIRADGVHGAPDLVVEILSPSTGRYDRGRKKQIYQASGVPEYWIVSPEARSIEVYRLKDGLYELDNCYSVYPDYLLRHMSEEERGAIPSEFRCHLFDDLAIRLEDVFEDLF